MNLNLILNHDREIDNYLFTPHEINENKIMGLFKYLKVNSSDIDAEDAEKIIKLCLKIKNSCMELKYRDYADRIIELLWTQTYSEMQSEGNELRSLLGKHKLSAQRKIPSIKKPKIEFSSEEKLLISLVIAELALMEDEQALSLSKILGEALKPQKNDQECTWRETWREHQNQNGLCVLHYLANFKNIRTVHKVLALMQNVDIQSNEGQTPLHMAFSNPQLIECFYYSNADLNLKNSCGMTSFEHAIFMGAYISVSTFIELNPYLIDKTGIKNLTPLSLAIQLEDPKMVDLLIAKGANLLLPGTNYIYEAAAASNPEIIKVFTDKSISLELNGYECRPALILACQKKEESVVRRLLEAGANPNIQDFQGYTPLLWSIKVKDFPTIKTLLEFRVDVNFPKATLKRYSPLIQAVLEGNALIATRLIQAGANVNEIEPSGQTFFEELYACQRLKFDEISKLKNRVSKKGLDKVLALTIISRRLLAQIWGIGDDLFFSINNQKIEYEGFNVFYLAQKIKENFINYLPRLREAFPEYFTPGLINKFLSSLQNVPLNLNLKETNAESILLKSHEFPQILPTGWLGHSTTIVIYKNRRLVKCNRGEGVKEHAVMIFDIKKEITPEIIDKIREKEDPDFFLSEIEQKLEGKEIGYIFQKDQKVGNCSWTSIKASIGAVILLLQEEIHHEVNGKMIREIYKSFHSFTVEQELEKYLNRCLMNREEFDWLLLSQIRMKLDRKLAVGKFFGLEKENYNKALTHFETKLSIDKCIATPQNKEAIIHYYIATGNLAGIKETLALGLDIHQSFGGMTPMQTAVRNKNSLIIAFLLSLQ